MNELRKDEMKKIEYIFEECNDTLILSCLQGVMGRAWVDNIEEPKSAQVITADFCFFKGKPNVELVQNIPDNYSNSIIIMVPHEKAWEALIEEVYNNKFERFMRYSLKKEGDIFDRKKLKAYVDNLSSDYRIVKIDEEIYNATQKEKWSSDLCAQFTTYDEYEKMGIGFVVKHNDEIVSGVSSYTVYNDGIEIEIDTREDYRRKGLAIACASKLILECLEKGLYPSWDAHNKGSLELAKKLGYHFNKEYVAYCIDLTK